MTTTDNTDWHADAFRDALRSVEGGAPRDLVKRAAPEAEDRGEHITADDLAEVLKKATDPDPFLTALGLQVHRWDAATDQAWTQGTSPSTPGRRNLICSLLGMNDAAAAALLQRRPIFVDRSIVITGPWSRWYTTQVAARHSFYWPHYRDYLLHTRQWPEANVTALDLATTSVVERLADPTREQAYQAKGLVVGYVQSGKTANFTGVSAKAIDAGYRLVIVMTGTIELLRAQTQRRMDMEMIGRQNIVGDLSSEQALADGIDYQDDPDWAADKFLDLGADPLATEIHRLTTHKVDYKKQFKNLKIDRSTAGKALHDPANLFAAGARVVVTKKNSTVLAKLVTDLRANRKAFAEIPVLIIDDESDQASVNTVNPATVAAAKAAGTEVVERKAINRCIAQMLELMPRAQYVGYTATPFANVFVDPTDEQGIFPKDFVIGLDRPAGYMGVEDFHDMDPDDTLEAETTPATGMRNQDAHVRDLGATDDAGREFELAAALDMFVLTGACKLYRAHQSPALTFRHHTMLVHEGVTTAQHKATAGQVKTLWTRAAFSTPAATDRLRALYDADVLPVSAQRTEEGVPALPDFDVLKPWIAQAIHRITEVDNNPVLVVNSDRDIQQQKLDFDRNDTWRVLIGGAKLSRGFTVEGLTVTYFRRPTTMSDSLTQMGRWFGFRHGYRDLVRLYIDRSARSGRKTYDLYEAFEAIARDESAFRRQLTRYAEWDGDTPVVLPAQIPPLVSQHLPWLQPTAGNKMFNARLDEQSDQVLAPVGYPNHVDVMHANLERWRPLLSGIDTLRPFPAGGPASSLQAFTGVVGATDVVDLLGTLTWLPDYGQRTVAPRLKYYRRLLKEAAAGDPRLHDLLVVMPQPGEDIRTIQGVGPRAVVRRDRRRRGGLPLFGEITDPKHRRYAEQLLGPTPPSGHALADMWEPDRGVLLVYLVQETKPDWDTTPAPALTASHPEQGLVVGFTLQLPHEAVGSDRVLHFSVINKEDPKAASVSTPSA
ncbi:Z1 domain-containing protein [uncultured Pseudokineococcus sp.]|uniref:Z1 domain-containing protein n=1 Tax=uncultured Pseudokineococcus sp. TaxID=1642928 RepID=UPI0026147938|nr:Z1 domain-containing protein [uncultured Pseudokineococcus sp.]